MIYNTKKMLQNNLNLIDKRILNITIYRELTSQRVIFSEAL